MAIKFCQTCGRPLPGEPWNGEPCACGSVRKVVFLQRAPNVSDGREYARETIESLVTECARDLCEEEASWDGFCSTVCKLYHYMEGQGFELAEPGIWLNDRFQVEVRPMSDHDDNDFRVIVTWDGGKLTTRYGEDLVAGVFKLLDIVSGGL